MMELAILPGLFFGHFRKKLKLNPEKKLSKVLNKLPALEYRFQNKDIWVTFCVLRCSQKKKTPGIFGENSKL